MSDHYVGLISGTSVDSIDAVVVELGATQPKLVAHLSAAFPDTVRDNLLRLAHGNLPQEIDRVGELDIEVGELLAKAALEVIDKAYLKPDQITAIGSHGQTIRHRPRVQRPFTWQVGNASTIAELTGIKTVSDFRRRDMAAGGQGAPLATAFHNAVLRDPREDRAVANIGGIGNLTLLPADPDAKVIGFDTGPGNCLMDEWALRNLGEPYDHLGRWGGLGRCDKKLLEELLSDPWFERPPPKSTGREDFNLDWLLRHQIMDLAAEDAQATLVHLTAESIARGLRMVPNATERLLVCGGGVHNETLMKTLDQRLPDCDVVSTKDYGVDPDWLEAMCFAWLAKRRLEGQPGNLPSVTGAKHDCLLGVVTQ